MSQLEDTDELQDEQARATEETRPAEEQKARIGQSSETEKGGFAEERESEEEYPSKGDRAKSWWQRWRLSVFIAAAVLVLALALWYFWKTRSSGDTSNAEPHPVVSVQVVKAERQPIAQQVSAVGTIFPRQQATVSAKISAQIKQMPLLVNKVVRTGEVIAVLESRDLAAQRNEAVAALAEARANQRSVVTGSIPQTNAQDLKALRDARANVANARATYERRAALYEKGGISKKELEASQLALTQAEDELRLAEQTVALREKSINPNDRALAEARVAQAQQHVGTLDAQLSYATIRAPLTGMVTDQFQFQGEFASAGAKLVNIADISQVIVKAPFPDTTVHQLKVGDTATVLPTSIPDDQMNGQVSLISHAADPASRTVDVWVTLANDAGRLRANDAAQVIITSEFKNDAIVVPASAVTLDSPDANTGTVMVVGGDSIAHQRKVTVGIQTPDKVEITEGLQEGEVVITQGNYELPDGTEVQVESSSENSANEGAGAGETHSTDSGGNLNGASPGSIGGAAKNSGQGTTAQGAAGGNGQGATDNPSASKSQQGTGNPASNPAGANPAGTRSNGPAPGSSNPATTQPVKPGGTSQGVPNAGGKGTGAKGAPPSGGAKP